MSDKYVRTLYILLHKVQYVHIMHAYVLRMYVCMYMTRN